MRGMNRNWVELGSLGVAAMLAVVIVGSMAAGRPAEVSEADEEALERARQEVQMLDILYKNAVVSITERYPRGQPAIMVAKDVFGAMREGGHHSAKLVDATESPLGVDSEPETDFERKAARAMRNGETYLDEVVTKNGEQRLLAATVVPAVHKRCAECHGVEEGDLLGFIRYEVPIR